MIYWLLIPVFAIGIVAVLMVEKRSGSKNSGQLDRQLIQNKLAEIETMTKGTGSQLKQAVIEADKLLDYCLKRLNYKGETMAKRLGSARPQLSDEKAVWNAHRLRNRLVHEQDVDLIGNTVPRAVADLKQAIMDIGAV